jgi:hypothetical protein
MLRKLLLVTVAVAAPSPTRASPARAPPSSRAGPHPPLQPGPQPGPHPPPQPQPPRQPPPYQADAGVGAPSLGLGWTALRCGTRILWRRLRRSTSGPRPVGSALDPGESVLVTEKIGGDFRTDGC